MPERYGEIFRTYLVRIFSHWVFALSVVLAAIGIVASLSFHTTSQFATFMLIGVGSTWSGMFLWRHLADLLVNERRNFYPRYCTPQLIIFTLISLLLAVGWPWLFAIHNGLSVVALVAMGLGCFSIAGIGAASQVFALGGMGGFLITMFVSGHAGARGFMFGDDPQLAGWLLVGAVLLFIWTMHRLAAKHADGKERLIGLAFAQANRQPRSSGELSRQWAQLGALRGIGSRRVRIPKNHSFLSAVQCWRQLNFVILWQTFCPALVLLLLLHHPQDARVLLSFGIGFMPTLILLAGFGGAAERWKFLQFESLLPLSRRRFVLEVFGAMAADMVVLLAGWILVFVMAFVGREISARQLAVILLCEIFIFIFNLGAATRLGCFRTIENELAIFALLVAMGPGALLGLLWGFGHIQAAIFSSLILAAIGVVVIRTAYRRWLLTEWG